jgi:hypothetical protein
MLLVLGVPAAFIVTGLTSPFLLAGQVEIALIEFALKEGVIRPEPLIMKWLIFNEMGGRWLLSLLGAIACITYVLRLQRRREKQAHIQAEKAARNATRKQTKHEKKMEKKAKRKQKETETSIQSEASAN